MATEKLNITLPKEIKESIKAEANRRAMKISAYIKYLHEKELLERDKIELAKKMGIYDEIEKTIVNKLLEITREV